MDRSKVERIELAPGYSISRIIKGGWHLAGGHGNIDPDQAVRDMAGFVEAGITTFDCADIYTGVEELIGRFRVQFPELAKEVQIHTKFVPDYSILKTITPEDVESTIDRSLKRLRVEQLDLVQFYWWDPDGIPGYLETAEVLHQLKRSGKIRHIGLTNFNTRQTKLIVERGVPILTNQVQYSPIDTRPEKELIPFCLQQNIQQLCYGTLAGGFFSSEWLEAEEPIQAFSNRSLTKYKLVIDDIGGWQHFQKILKALSDISKKHDASLAQTALAWTLGQTGVAAVIVGATSNRHLEENLQVFDLSLDDEDYTKLANLIQLSKPLEGDCFDLERDKKGRHGSIMKYNENSNES